MNPNTTFVVVANSNVEVPTASSISAWLEPYGVQLSDLQVLQIQNYLGILVFWNHKFNLTSVEDPQEIVSRHFGESFFCAKFMPAEKSRLADVGSGAGFPGLALKIVRPDTEVFLIEQDTRKAAFLNEVARTLHLESVKVLRTHYETLNPDFGDFDAVIARAIGNHKTLLRWASPRLSPSGRVILLLGLEDATKLTHLKDWHWSQPHPMPQSSKRVIIVGNVTK
ncbi:MAG TPA: 16S rRNA (guanine(527)-N(7))-methyltransferase RsmG [Candidatus Limnocylindrales bacterium]|nr:16S rRNA (guanine(527)-N(7))-methyltransferase RsmG [Candidatus Limnocylindrales bacterium]